MFSLILPLIISCLSLVLAQGTGARPSDPFYDAPDNLGSYKNGEVFRRRSIPLTLDLGVKVSGVVQVAYKTQLADGGDSYSISTIFKPENPNSRIELFSYQIFEDAVQLDCAPSWTFKEGFFTPGVSVIDNNVTLAFSTQLEQGRYVVVPDHEGAVSAFFCGRQEGYAGLDGIRAAINELNATNDNTPVIMYGYSGGAHATAWMVNVQDYYAPDLNVIAAAYGGTLVDALGELNYADIPSDPVKGSVAAMYTGLLVGYPAQNETIWSHISQYIQNTILQLRWTPNLCSSQVLLQNYNKSIRENIDVDIATFPAFVEIFKNESLLTSYSGQPVATPKYPRYIYHGTNDEIAPYNLTLSYINQQKASGGNIDWVVYNGLGHIEAGFAGENAAYDWIDQQFDNYH